MRAETQSSRFLKDVLQVGRSDLRNMGQGVEARG